MNKPLKFNYDLQEFERMFYPVLLKYRNNPKQLISIVWLLCKKQWCEGYQEGKTNFVDTEESIKQLFQGERNVER